MREFEAAKRGEQLALRYAKMSAALDAVAWDDARYVTLGLAVAGVGDELGLFAEAQASLERLKEVAARTQRADRERLGYYLCVSYVRSGSCEQAQSALAYYGEQVDQSELVQASRYWFAAGLVADLADDVELALRRMRKSRRFAEAAGQADGVATALIETARLSLRRMDFQGAEFALDAATSVEFSPSIAVYLEVMRGFAAAGAGDLARGGRLLSEVLERSRCTDIASAVARAALLLAALRFVQGGTEEAHEHLRAAARETGLDDEFDAVLGVVAGWFEGRLDAGQDGHARELVHAIRTGERRVYRHAFAGVLAGMCHSECHSEGGFSLSAQGVLTDPSGGRVDLRRRGALRRILEVLREGGPVSTGELFAAGWPEVTQVGENGFRRVYTEIHRLRELGLEIETCEGGYLLKTVVQGALR